MILSPAHTGSAQNTNAMKMNRHMDGRRHLMLAVKAEPDRPRESQAPPRWFRDITAPAHGPTRWASATAPWRKHPRGGGARRAYGQPIDSWLIQADCIPADCT